MLDENGHQVNTSGMGVSVTIVEHEIFEVSPYRIDPCYGNDLGNDRFGLMFWYCTYSASFTLLGCCCQIKESR